MDIARDKIAVLLRYFPARKAAGTEQLRNTKSPDCGTSHIAIQILYRLAGLVPALTAYVKGR